MFRRLIPEELPAATFTLAHGRARSATTDELRNPALVRPFRGLRAVRDPGPAHYQRCIAAAPLLRDTDRISHVSALVLFGCPIRLAPNEPVHIESRYGTGIRRTAGIRGHTWRENKSAHRRTLFIRGTEIAVSAPDRALLHAAGALTFPELVIATEHLLRLAPGGHGTLPVLTRQRLESAVASSRGRSGARLREAARIAIDRAESRMETLLRLTAIRAGVPGLIPQLAILARDETLIGRFDLADHLSRTLFEYDGEQHRLVRHQYLRDITRLERARSSGWRVERFHREDFPGGGRDVASAHRVGRRILNATGRPPLRPSPELALLLDEPLPPGHIPAHPQQLVSDFGAF